MRTHSCHGASIISIKPATFAKPTAETAVDEVSNLSNVKWGLKQLHGHNAESMKFINLNARGVAHE